jgi:hypothetical protein
MAWLRAAVFVSIRRRTWLAFATVPGFPEADRWMLYRQKSVICSLNINGSVKFPANSCECMPGAAVTVENRRLSGDPTDGLTSIGLGNEEA